MTPSKGSYGMIGLVNRDAGSTPAASNALPYGGASFFMGRAGGRRPFLVFPGSQKASHDLSERTYIQPGRFRPGMEWRAATVRRDSFKVTYAAFGADATKQVRLLPTPTRRRRVT